MVHGVYFMYIYVCMVAHIARVRINRVRLPTCTWSAEQEKRIVSCPRSRLRIWSRETGLAVPSRVSLLVYIHTQAESGVYLRDSSRVPRRRPFSYLKTAIRHRVSPEFIGSRDCIPMAFTAESPPARGQ